METQDFKPGDILLLEYKIAGIDYDTGYFVLRSFLDDHAFLSLVSENARGLYPIDSICMIARADLKAFTPTGETANLEP